MNTIGHDRQQDRHVWDRTEYLLQSIMEALGITLPVLDLTDWYAIGDEQL